LSGGGEADTKGAGGEDEAETMKEGDRGWGWQGVGQTWRDRWGAARLKFPAPGRRYALLPDAELNERPPEGLAGLRVAESRVASSSRRVRQQRSGRLVRLRRYCELRAQLVDNCCFQRTVSATAPFYKLKLRAR
jgi:hypothetical protein